MLLLLYLIKNLHQTTTVKRVRPHKLSCILLKIYIKPQPGYVNSFAYLRCILLKIYIKPQRKDQTMDHRSRCILLKIYIKPQPQIL